MALVISSRVPGPAVVSLFKSLLYRHRMVRVYTPFILLFTLSFSTSFLCLMMHPLKILFIYCRIFECHDQDFLSVAKFQSSKAKEEYTGYVMLYEMLSAKLACCQTFIECPDSRRGVGREKNYKEGEFFLFFMMGTT